MKKVLFKHYAVLLVPLLFLTACGSGRDSLPVDSMQATPELRDSQPSTNLDLEAHYDKIDELLADISGQMGQPNVLKSDIERGWYLGGENDKKYGTPDGWIYIEDGDNSKWISPNALEEEDYIDSRKLCKDTAGIYIASCLNTSDSDCQYTDTSYCQCPDSTGWVEEQGCIMISAKGSFIAINAEELSRGYYLGLPNQKKLNTPSSWIWSEDGKNSNWHKP